MKTVEVRFIGPTTITNSADYTMYSSDLSPEYAYWKQAHKDGLV